MLQGGPGDFSLSEIYRGKRKSSVKSIRFGGITNLVKKNGREHDLLVNLYFLTSDDKASIKKYIPGPNSHQAGPRNPHHGQLDDASFDQ